MNILHIVGSLIGGVGNWVRNLQAQVDTEKYKFDFLVYNNLKAFPEESTKSVHKHGGRVIYCPPPQHLWKFSRHFKKVLSDFGPYAVVHSHAQYFNGHILRLAHHAGVPVRISHSHMDFSPYKFKHRFLRYFYLKLMSYWLNQHATGGLAASNAAAADLYGPNWPGDQRWRVLFCGIDLAPFHMAADPLEVRGEMGIPAGALVVGHVGALWEQKNHKFIIEVFSRLSQLKPEVYLLLVGSGNLLPQINQQVVSLGLESKVKILGYRQDVPRLLRGAMDVFLFPSLYEGLGLALVEAQACGLPCVISDVIPEEADVIKPLVQRLSLTQPPSAWAEAILAARKYLSPEEALAMVEEGPFNIKNCAHEMEQFYQEMIRNC